MATQSSKKARRSGNPAARGAAAMAEAHAERDRILAEHAREVTTPESWISRTSGDEVVTLPSGNRARVRRSGPEAFLEQGLIPDPLTATIEKSIRSKKGLRPEKQVDIMDDPVKLGALVEMLDRTCCYAVVEPHVEMPPTCTECDELDTPRAPWHKDESHERHHKFVERPREPGVLYADRVDMDDKMFILNFTLGGTRDLERFRRELGVGVAGLGSLQGSKG